MKTLQLASGLPSINSGLTRYTACATAGITTAASSEARVQITYRTAGVLSNLYVNCRTNSLNGTTTVRVRKNGGDGNQVVSITSSSTGTFEDTTNTDTIAAGDEINYSIVTAGSSGSVSPNCIQTWLEPSIGGAVNRNSTLAGGGAGLTFSSATEYLPLVGNNGTVTVEAETQFKSGVAGVIKNLFAYISGNSRGTTSTYTLRKNGGNGNLTVSITAGATGIFEDTSNTDTVAVGDNLNVALTQGSGGGTLTSHLVSTEFTSTTNTFLMIGGPTSGVTQNQNLTRYYSFTGTQSSTENVVESKVGTNMSVSRLFLYLSANTVTATSTITLRKNTADTALTASIAASTTGVFEDTTNSVSCISTDLICMKIVTGSGGTSLTLRMIGASATGLFPGRYFTPFFD